MPLLCFLLLALVCLALLGFACACSSDQPMQAVQQALSVGPALPALVEIWSLAVLFVLGSAAVALRRAPRTPSPARMQSLLL
jgi:hypothetical protein